MPFATDLVLKNIIAKQWKKMNSIQSINEGYGPKTQVFALDSHTKMERDEQLKDQ